MRRMQKNKYRKTVSRQNHYLNIIFIASLLLLIFLTVSAVTKRTPLTFFSFAQSSGFVANGPMVGSVTSNSAVVWMRTGAVPEGGNNIPYVVLSTSESGAMPSSPNLTYQFAKAKFTSEESGWDGTWKAEITGLSPNTTYFYNLVENGQEQLSAPYPKFETFPEKGTNMPFKFLILTDFATNDSTQPPVVPKTETFNQVAVENPAFVVIGGDLWHNNAADTAKDKTSFITTQRNYFREMLSLNSSLGKFDNFVKNVLPNFALVHFYDDHDLGQDNPDKTYKYKKEALEILQEYFPTYPVSEYGDWQKFSYGQADFFVLDARSQRDNEKTIADDANKSMLDGDNLGASGQLAWLQSGLKNSTAKWKFILSPVVFNKTHAKLDAWYGFQTERKQLIRFIKNNNINGVVIISGDSHGGGIDNGKNSDFPEMLVPTANKGQCFTTKNAGNWSEGIYGSYAEKRTDPPCPGYGVVSVFTNPDRIIMKVNDENGKKKLKMRYFLNPQDAKTYANLPDDL